jgi:hypothetical protein
MQTPKVVNTNGYFQAACPLHYGGLGFPVQLLCPLKRLAAWKCGPVGNKKRLFWGDFEMHYGGLGFPVQLLCPLNGHAAW